MPTDAKRYSYAKDVLGDPAHMVFFTLANGITVAVTSTLGWRFQVVAIAAVAVVYFAVGLVLGNMRYRDELFRALPGQIQYFNVSKRLEIEDSGLGNVTCEYTGLNMGETALRSLYHIFEYDREKPIESPILAFIDDEAVPVTVKSHSKVTKDGVEGHTTKIQFDFPEPVRKGHQFPRHRCRLEGIDYRKAFTAPDYSSHKVEVITQFLQMEVTVPTSLQLADVQEKVVDFHSREDPLETDRMRVECPPVLSRDRSKVAWEISNPRLTYSYKLAFMIEKTT